MIKVIMVTNQKVLVVVLILDMGTIEEVPVEVIITAGVITKSVIMMNMRIDQEGMLKDVSRYTNFI